MSDAEILAMGAQIKTITAPNAALLLWVTMPRLDLGMDVLKTWGFRFTTTAFTWVKTTKAGAPATGPGYYTASNPEIVLLGVKGRMKPVKRLVNSVILTPRREHSRKPDEVRDRIVQVFGDLSRVELFCRHPAPGWDSFGNELDGRDIREVLAV